MKKITKNSRLFLFCLLIAVTCGAFVVFIEEAVFGKKMLALLSYGVGFLVAATTLSWIVDSAFVACPKCQKKINFRSKWCNFCGEKLEAKNDLSKMQ